MRLHAETATIENGFVFLPEQPRGSPTLAKLAAFPGGRSGDQVDSTAQALVGAKRKPTGGGVDRGLSADGRSSAPSLLPPGEGPGMRVEADGIGQGESAAPDHGPAA